MKRILLGFTFSLGIMTLLAQPSGDVFPDFTYTDLEGTEHHLQSYLDQGKTVVIDVFATWCTVCQNSVPGIEELYNTLGQAGDESMVVLSFERDPSTTNEAEFVSEFGVNSPVITGATDLIADSWNITYQPRYFVICPDGSFLSELVTPIYSDPQPLIDLSEECSSVTGISESSLDEDFQLITTSFENIVRYESSIDLLEYRILDLTGAVVHSGSFTDGMGQIDLSFLPQGMYLFQVSNETSYLTKRMIKTS